MEDLEPALTIMVTDQHGVEHSLPAEEGWRAMEVIRDWGLDIKAECGGACACATCHVHVDPAWAALLPPPSAEEIDMLDGAFDVDDDLAPIVPDPAHAGDGRAEAEARAGNREVASG